jgi:hypothetical protein
MTSRNACRAGSCEGDPRVLAVGRIGELADKMNVVSRTLEQPTWRDTTIIRENVIESVRALKAQAGRSILTDGSSQLA